MLGDHSHDLIPFNHLVADASFIFFSPYYQFGYLIFASYFACNSIASTLISKFMNNPCYPCTKKIKIKRDEKGKRFV